MKRYIFIIIFSVATNGYAGDYVQPENDDPGDDQKTPTELWMEMRQQPEITETSGIKRPSILFSEKSVSAMKGSAKVKRLPKEKTTKIKKSDKPEGATDGASKALVSKKEDKKEENPDGASKPEGKPKKPVP